MLGIHREVSGEATWDRPFEVAGLEDRTFAWTHRGIAEFLGGQWAETPHGPHCENTKSWPFCLSAAGLGLAAHRRDARHADPLGLPALGRGHVQEEVHGLRRARKPEVGRALLRPAPRPRARPQPDPRALSRRSTSRRRTGRSASCCIGTRSASVGWDKWYLPVSEPGRRPAAAHRSRFLLAREYGDHTTERRLGREARAARERALLRRGGRPRPRRVRALLLSTASAIRAARRARSTC